MTPSIPCAKCGQVDDLETVNPLGIHLDKAVPWNCRCGSTRAVAVIDYMCADTDVEIGPHVEGWSSHLLLKRAVNSLYFFSIERGRIDVLRRSGPSPPHSYFTRISKRTLRFAFAAFDSMSEGIGSYTAGLVSP